MKIITWLMSVFALFASCLREIFDESAYQRFLHQHRVAASQESYDEFCRDEATVSSRRPRCC